MKKDHFIKSISIKNFRGIKEIETIDFNSNSQWIFLTGENGFGKTSVLQAIATGLYGKENVNALSQEERKQAKFEIKLENNSIYKGSEDSIFKNIRTYGAERIMARNASTFSRNVKDLISTDSIFNKPAHFFDIEDILKEFFLRRQEEKIREATQKLILILKKIVPDLDTIGLSHNTFNQIVVYKEKFSTDLLPFSYLFTGFRSWIIILGDIIGSFYNEYNLTDIDTANVKDIVLIDEFDAHLHPKWQYLLPKSLSEIFPNVQFIVSTHSPIPLLGSPRNSTFLNVNRNIEQGIYIENWSDIDIKNLTPNTVFSSPMFDLESLIANSNEDLEEVRTETTYSKILENKEIEKQISELDEATIKKIESLFKSGSR